MTKGVKICIAAVAVLFVGSFIACVILFKSSASQYIEIVQDGKVIQTIDLANTDDQTFRIETPDGGWNEVVIEDRTVRISDADCPDHTCIKTGVLRSESVPIVCLPHKLVIRYSDGNGGEQ